MAKSNIIDKVIEEEEELRELPPESRAFIDKTINARKKLRALSPESRAIVKKALDGDKSALRELPREIAGEFEELQELAAANRILNNMVREMLDGEESSLFINEIARNKNKLAEALRTGDVNNLDADELNQLSAISIFITEADADGINCLGWILGISAKEMEAIKTRLVPKGGMTITTKPRQMNMPLDGFPEYSDKEQVSIKESLAMTQGMHSLITRYAISKLAQRVPMLILDGTSDNIEVIRPKGERKAIEISVSVGTPEGLTTNKKLTLFDMMVVDAIGNLADDGYIDSNGVMVITPEMVYRQINGLADGERVSKKAVELVKCSMVKLNDTKVKADFSAHLRAATRGKVKEYKYEGHIIEGYNVMVRFKDNREIDGWKILDIPIIYKYSKAVKQIATVDRRVLTMGDISNTQPVMLMRYYLLQQIERIREKPGKPGETDVKYDSIFTATGDTVPMEKTAYGRKQRANRIKAIKAILDVFKKVGHIAGWRETGKGNRGQKDGVEIDTIPRDKLIGEREKKG